jgi:hypothetical protein
MKRVLTSNEKPCRDCEWDNICNTYQVCQGWVPKGCLRIMVLAEEICDEEMECLSDEV